MEGDCDINQREQTAVFLPVYLSVLFIGLKYRDHPTLKGFVKGATAAASGAIAGATLILEEGSITDATNVVSAITSFWGCAR
jgi:chromate transporter